MGMVATHYYTNSGRGPSAFWKDCPIGQLLKDPSEGAYVFNDFMDAGANASGLSFASTGGTVLDGNIQGGGLVIGSDDDNEAVVLKAPSAFKISRTSNKFWFEARVKFSNITDSKIGAFIGLMDNTTTTAVLPLADDGSIGDANMVGFWRVEGDGDKLDTEYKANGVTAVNLQADAITTVADTFVKVGMVFTPVDNLLTFYKDGVALSTTKTIPSAEGTDFPNDVYMGLILAVKNAAGSSPGTVTIDWWRAAQVY